jgi:hypothetical protein
MPATTLAESSWLLPWQNDTAPEGVIVADAGIGLTVTVTVLLLLQPCEVAVTV